MELSFVNVLQHMLVAMVNLTALHRSQLNVLGFELFLVFCKFQGLQRQQMQNGREPGLLGNMSRSILTSCYAFQIFGAGLCLGVLIRATTGIAMSQQS